MLSFLSPPRLARWTARHPWITVGVWVALLAGAMLATTQLRFDEEQVIIGSESYTADERIDDLRGEERPQETIVVEAQ